MRDIPVLAIESDLYAWNGAVVPGVEGIIRIRRAGPGIGWILCDGKRVEQLEDTSRSRAANQTRNEILIRDDWFFAARNQQCVVCTKRPREVRGSHQSTQSP